MRALGVVLFGVGVFAPPTLAADAALPPATFRRLAAAAIATYEQTTSQAGSSGLRENLERCYPTAILTHDRLLAASCVMQDRFATQIQVNAFPNMPDNYFTFKAFSERAAAAVSATVPDRLASNFIATLGSSEDAAAHHRMLELKARSRGHRGSNEVEQ